MLRPKANKLDSLDYIQWILLLVYCSTQAQTPAQLSLSSTSFAWREPEAVSRHP